MEHAYMAELRLYGEQLDPNEISAQLNLQPSSNTLCQSQIKRTRPAIPYWGYNGEGEIGFQLEWASLEEGLNFLLKGLSPKKAEVIALTRQFDGIWWCGHLQSSFDGGPTLSAKLLAEISSYEIPLFLGSFAAY